MKGHRGKYQPNPHTVVRDKAYPSEIAAQRPALATRIHCPLEWSEQRESEEATIRGDQGYRDPASNYTEPARPGPQHGDVTEDRVALFNKQLRAGHGWRNAGDE